MPADIESPPPALVKRIRRRVVAKTWDFFAATAPGFEKLCEQECAALGFFRPMPRIVPGGLDFSGRVQHAYRSNLHLRTANRVLMRIEEFQAANFRRLKKKLRALPWELFVKPDRAVSFRVSSARSRLYHTKAVEQCAYEALDEAPGRGPRPSDNEADTAPQTVFIRIVEDRVSLSLDSSGDNLYKRGLKVPGGRAPLRETAAAAILMLLGYGGDGPLIDPMCGSGSFSLEAAMIAQGIPPGWYRSFSFFEWPCFSPGKWEFIRKEAGNAFRPMERPAIFASDIDSGACRHLRECVGKAGFQNAVEIEDGLDFFDLHPEKLGRQGGAVVLNPPYGLRMDPAGKNAGPFFEEIFRKLKKDFKGWKAAVVVPDSRYAASAPSAWQKRRLFHGGLDVRLICGTVPR